MMNLILTWWLNQLRSLLPAQWRDPAMRLPDGLIIDCGPLGTQPGHATLARRRRRKEMRLGPLGAGPIQHRNTPFVLRLSGAVLERDVTLPSQVEADVARVLTYDMGRLAPFDAADLFWDWRIIRRDEIRKRLTVRLWYLPRRTVQPWLDWLNSFGLAPDGLEVVGPTGSVTRLLLRERTGGRRRLRWGAAGAGTAVLVLLAAPFLLQSHEMAALDAEQDALQPQARRVAQLQARLAALVPNAAANAAEAARIGDAVQILAAITNALPDDTVLTDLTFRERRVTITGSSEQAAQLIAALSASHLLHDPAFTAPIVRDSGTGRDSFALRVGLVP